MSPFAFGVSRAGLLSEGTDKLPGSGSLGRGVSCLWVPAVTSSPVST